MEKEDGEMSDDNAMIIDDNMKEPATELNKNRTILYKAAKNGIVVQTLEKVNAAKLEERAKRFGLNLVGSRVVTQKQIDELYEKAGITGNERHFRFDTLHLNGINGLTSREIFEYLEDYKPVALEKIDDISCNMVCQDHIAAALALLVHSREIRNEQLNEMLSEKSHHHWREGMPHPKKDLILMRFATNADKKMPKQKDKEVAKVSDDYYDESMDPRTKNPWGDLCRSWGVYDHQEVFQRKFPPKYDYENDVEEFLDRIPTKNNRLAMRLGKRRYMVQEEDESDSDAEWKKKSKTPRMRMRADDEESKQKRRHALRDLIDDEDSYDEQDKFTPLSIEVVNSRNDYVSRQTTKLSDKFKHQSQQNPRGNVLSRLGAKISPTREREWSDESSDESDHNISSKVQKVISTGTAKKTNSVWFRLDNVASAAEDERSVFDDSSQSDLRRMIKSKKGKASDDLRERLSKAKKSNLRIEIDNY